MHGLRSIEYTGGTLLLVQCLKKKIEARGGRIGLVHVKVVKKREKKKKKQGRISRAVRYKKSFVYA